MIHWENFSEEIVNHQLPYEEQRIEGNFAFRADLPVSNESTLMAALDVNVQAK